MQPPIVGSTPMGETEYTTSMSEMAKSNGTHDLSRIEIEPTKNGGFSVRASYRQADSGKRDAPSPYVDPDQYAFSNFAELSSFLSEQFGAPAAPPAPSPDASLPAA